MAPLGQRLFLRSAAAALGAALVLGVAGATSAQDEAAADGGIDGTWLVDTSYGTFAEDLTSGSWAGFRVNEVLNPGGET